MGERIHTSDDSLLSVVGVQKTYTVCRMLVNNLLQTNVERFVMLAFWWSSPMSRMFHSRRVKLSLATLALHIFSRVGCKRKDVRNVALQHVEIFLVDGTLVQDLKPEFKPFPPWQGKIHWHFELSHKTLVEIINTDYVLINLRTNVNS